MKNTAFEALLNYIKGKEIEQNFDLSKLETLANEAQKEQEQLSQNLKTISTEDLKAELKARGFYTDNLWQEADIDTLVENYNEDNEANLQLTSAHKQDILRSVLNGGGCMQNINDELSNMFDNYIEENGLNEPGLDDDTQDARNLDKY